MVPHVMRLQGVAWKFYALASMSDGYNSYPSENKNYVHVLDNLTYTYLGRIYPEIFGSNPTFGIKSWQN